MPTNIKEYTNAKKMLKEKIVSPVLIKKVKPEQTNTQQTKVKQTTMKPIVITPVKAPETASVAIPIVGAAITPLAPPVIAPVIPMTKAEYFEKMFGKKHKAKAVKDLIVPLIVNNKFGRNAHLNIIDGKHYIPSKDLKMVLVRFLPQKLLAEIFDKQNINQHGVDIKILHSFGIDSYFNEKDVIVYISISPEVRIPTKIKFTNNIKEMDEEFEKILDAKSATISGASNFYIKDSFYNMTGGNSLERKAAVLSNKTFINYKDYIFNTGFVINEQKTSTTEIKQDLIRRDYTYVSKDSPKNNDRYTVGDVSLVGLSHMPAKGILGFSLVHHYNVTKRIQNSIRVTEKEIFLNNESQMEIRVNDVLVRTMTLQPGVHLLSDFPLISGRNNVKIKLTDIFGEVKEINFNDFYYAELLKKGVFTYGISAGVGISNDQTKGISYEEKEKYFSGNFNIGICKNATLNTGVQMSNDLYAYENELFIGTNYGVFSGYGILSKHKELDYGHKYGYSYRNVIDKTSINISKDIVDSNYRTILSNILSDTSSETFNANVNTTFRNGIQLSASYSNRYLSGKSIEVKKFAYNQRVSNSWNVKLDLHESKIDLAKPAYGAMLTLRYSPVKTNIAYLASIEQENASGEFETNTKAAININKHGQFGLDASIDYENIENLSEKESLRLRYSDQAYTIHTNYAQIAPDSGINSKSANINFATAIAFVDNEYAITKPVSNSFILVKNDDVFSEEPLGIKSYNHNEPIPSFVMPTSDYNMRNITVDDKDLAFGIDLKQSNFEIYSKYREGTLVKISPKFILTPKGILHDKDDKPLSMKVFKVFSIAEDGTKTVIKENPLFFTNTKGKFIIANMEEGNYFVQEINAQQPYSFNFTLKSEQSGGGLVNIGTIKALGGPIVEDGKKVESQIELKKGAKVDLENNTIANLDMSLKLEDTTKKDLVECYISVSNTDKKCKVLPKQQGDVISMEINTPNIVDIEPYQLFVDSAVD